MRPGRQPPGPSAAGLMKCRPRAGSSGRRWTAIRRRSTPNCGLASSSPTRVRHATDADWVTIAVSHRGATVHVDVMDDGQTGLPHWREATGEDEGGRGFLLVNEIAQRWGFLRERGLTCIFWFELVP